MSHSLYRGTVLVLCSILLVGCGFSDPPPQKDVITPQSTLTGVRINSLSQTTTVGTELQVDFDILYASPGGTGATVNEVLLSFYIDDLNDSQTYAQSVSASPVDLSALYTEAPYVAIHEPDVDELQRFLPAEHRPFQYRDFDRVEVLVSVSLDGGEPEVDEKEFFYRHGVGFVTDADFSTPVVMNIPPVIRTCEGGQQMSVQLYSYRRWPTDVRISSYGNRLAGADGLLDTSCVELVIAPSGLALTDELGNALSDAYVTLQPGQLADPDVPGDIDQQSSPVTLDFTGPQAGGTSQFLPSYPQFGRRIEGQCVTYNGRDSAGSSFPNPVRDGGDCCACLNDLTNACSVNDRLEVSECFGTDTLRFSATADVNGYDIDAREIRPIQGRMNCTTSANFNAACEVSWEEP